MIDTEEMRVRLKGNGETKSFQFPFKLNKPDDLKVSTYDGENLVEQKNFSISPTDGGYPTNGGTVTYPESGEAVSSDITVIIERSMRLVQQDSYERNDTFSVENLEKSLDTVVQQIQQVNDGMQRSVKFPANISYDIDPTFPANLQAGDTIMVDEDGKKLIRARNPEVATQQAEASASSALSYKNAAKQSEDNAKQSEIKAKVSEGNANVAEANAKASSDLAQKWAESAESPDGQSDSESPTGKTLSSKEWAKEAKVIAQSLGNPIKDIEREDTNLKATYADGSDKSLSLVTLTVQEVIDIMFPVGVVIPFAKDSTPPFTSYGTWEKVGEGRTLWGADSSHTAGATIEAGLPNITGGMDRVVLGSPLNIYEGAIYQDGTIGGGSAGGGSGVNYTNIKIDASRSNAIYGKSTTVQPAAYVVNFWKRTA